MLASHLSLANSPVLVKDLHLGWLEHTERGYMPIQEKDLDVLQTIYFKIDPLTAWGRHILIRSPEKWQLFFNGKLIYSGTEDRLLSLDSLPHDANRAMFIGIHASNGVKNITTQLVSFTTPLREQSFEKQVRPPTFFRDYAILVSIFLTLFLLVLYRTNQQLTIDYFSFAKIFSASERNENQLTSRITSSVNLLFYLFCALLTGFLLSAIFYSAGPFFQAARS